jgi:hypothetical protein
VNQVETRIDDTHVILDRFARIEVGKWIKLRLASVIRMSSWVDLRVSRSVSEVFSSPITLDIKTDAVIPAESGLLPRGQ